MFALNCIASVGVTKRTITCQFVGHDLLKSAEEQRGAPCFQNRVLMLERDPRS